MSLLNSDDNDYCSSKQTKLVFIFSSWTVHAEICPNKAHHLILAFVKLKHNKQWFIPTFGGSVCIFLLAWWTAPVDSGPAFSWFPVVLHHHPLHWRPASRFVNFAGSPASALQRHMQIPWLIRTDNIPDRCWEWDVNKHCDALFSEAWWCLTAPSSKTHGSFFS